jgi:hypothetical protein
MSYGKGSKSKRKKENSNDSITYPCSPALLKANEQQHFTLDFTR